MWVATPEGFFSAVADAQEDVLQVRCRSKKDALGLARWLVENEVAFLNDDYPTVESLVLEWPGRDYPCRVLVWREQWAAYMLYVVDQITYRNFKNEVKARQGGRRAATYGRVWGVLLDIEKEDRPEPKRQPTQTRWDETEPDGDDSFDTWLDGFMQRNPNYSFGNTDDRCPRCDKFLGDVGVDGDGDCKRCKDELYAAEDNDDADRAREIQFELGYGEMR